MRKSELAQAIASDTDLSQKEAQEVITAFTDQVAQAMARGQTVNLVGFGTFSARERSARSGRNPQTGEAIEIPAGKTVGFKPGKGLKEAVQE